MVSTCRVEVPRYYYLIMGVCGPSGISFTLTDAPLSTVEAKRKLANWKQQSEVCRYLRDGYKCYLAKKYLSRIKGTVSRYERSGFPVESGLK